MRLLKLRDSYKNAPSITWESTESDEMEEWRERSYGLNFYKIGFYEKTHQNTLPRSGRAARGVVGRVLVLHRDSSKNEGVYERKVG